MSDAIYWILTTKVKEGELDNVKTLMTEMIETIQAEAPDVTHYEWFITEDEQTVQLYERFVDSDAALAQMKRFGDKFAQRFMASLKITNYAFYGNASETLVKQLKKVGAVQMNALGGFHR